jgi:GDP-L-fucose synthase
MVNKRIVVTGGAGFLGRHIVAELYTRGYNTVCVPRSREFDLRTLPGIQGMLFAFEPQIMIHAASHSGGIGLNKAKPAELFFDNAIMGITLMDAAYRAGVEKFVQIGTVCEYPKFTHTPFIEGDLWNGYPEETNAPYGIAKKALLVQGQAYRQQYGFNVIHLLPVNLYGPGDNFNPDSSHVIPALIKKFAEAHESKAPFVILWGTGTASREFLYVEDAAEAIVSATELYNGAEPINIGTGSEITMGALARMIADKIGYIGEIIFDTSKPDGQPRRCLDVQKAYKEFDFEAKTRLGIGLDKTIEWYYTKVMNENQANKS